MSHEIFKEENIFTQHYIGNKKLNELNEESKKENEKLRKENENKNEKLRK